MTKGLKNIYNKFPKEENCINFLEGIIWEGTPSCPYCTSIYVTPIKSEHRYHCNTCNTSFSITVGTVFHRTRCDLQKWFYAIKLLMSDKMWTARDLADEIATTKDTAWLIANKIQNNLKQNRTFFEIIANEV